MKQTFHFTYQFILSLFLIVLLQSCASIQSGKFIKLKQGDTLDSIAKKYKVAHVAILNANRYSPWGPGKWIFIPQEIGILNRSFWPNSSTKQYSKESFANGRFLWPVPDSHRVSSAFGARRGYKIHEGIDIPAKEGTDIVCVEDGVVESSGIDQRGYGKMIVVKHRDGIKTLYAHAFKMLIETNQKVYKGQVIGLVGSTGKSTGPHLHFEVERYGEKVDPFPYFF